MIARNLQNSFKDGFSKVSSKRLDDIDVPKSPSLIKIDVEGMEINVISGAKAFLKRHNFPPIVFESWSLPWFYEQRQRLLLVIEELGYKISKFADADYVAQHPVHPVHVKFEAVNSESMRIFRVR